jgi:hypothetical protein
LHKPDIRVHARAIEWTDDPGSPRPRSVHRGNTDSETTRTHHVGGVAVVVEWTPVSCKRPRISGSGRARVCALEPAHNGSTSVQPRQDMRTLVALIASLKRPGFSGEMRATLLETPGCLGSLDVILSVRMKPKNSISPGDFILPRARTPLPPTGRYVRSSKRGIMGIKRAREPSLSASPETTPVARS